MIQVDILLNPLMMNHEYNFIIEHEVNKLTVKNYCSVMSVFSFIISIELSMMNIAVIMIIRSFFNYFTVILIYQLINFSISILIDSFI